jgi:hypothetical protein
MIDRGLRNSGVKQFPRGQGHDPRARFACVLINRPVVSAFGQTGHRADIASAPIPRELPVTNAILSFKRFILVSCPI